MSKDNNIFNSSFEKHLRKGEILMYPKELVKLLEKNGWVKISQSGSHLKMRKRKPDGNNTYTQ